MFMETTMPFHEYIRGPEDVVHIFNHEIGIGSIIFNREKSILGYKSIILSALTTPFDIFYEGVIRRLEKSHWEYCIEGASIINLGSKTEMVLWFTLVRPHSIYKPPVKYKSQILFTEPGVSDHAYNFRVTQIEDRKEKEIRAFETELNNFMSRIRGLVRNMNKAGKAFKEVEFNQKTITLAFEDNQLKIQIAGLDKSYPYSQRTTAYNFIRTQLLIELGQEALI